jgi:integration host factor subunit alpha
MTLIKADIVEKIAKKGFTKRKSTQMVETILEIIKNSLENGEDVLISGFGKFCVKDKRETEEGILKPGMISFWMKEE